MDLSKVGSMAAKNGFQNERDVAAKFNNWKEDGDVNNWLTIMGYNTEDIQYVEADVVSGYKVDLNVVVKIKVKDVVDTENIQVKLVSGTTGKNQVDKRWLGKYKQMWSMPDKVCTLLKHFTGQLKPYRKDVKDDRRMFLNEFTDEERDLVLDWFRRNKAMVVSDILKGKGEFATEWVLVTQKLSSEVKWALKDIGTVMKHYSEGDVRMSPRGSISLGRIGIQRKGGDSGRNTAQMLQFHINPLGLFNIA